MRFAIAFPSLTYTCALCYVLIIISIATFVNCQINVPPLKGYPSAYNKDTGTATVFDGYSYLYNSALFQGQPPFLYKGISGNLTINQPTLANEDFHTLAEITAELDGNIVEVGWTVSHSSEGQGPIPSLFVFHWVNGQGTCYNECGFIPLPGAKYYPGMALSNFVSTSVEFRLQFMIIDNDKEGWWVWFDDEWIGYFPSSLWTEAGFNFSSANVLQWFGEVCASSVETTTQMGNGMFGLSNQSAKVWNPVMIDTNYKETCLDMKYVYFVISNSSLYDMGAIANVECNSVGSLSSFGYGGPGT